MADGKIMVLVIPDLFPEDENDVKGVFIPDYLRATAAYCANSVLVMKVSGKRMGFAREKRYEADIIRYTFSDQPVSVFSKPFYYYAFFKKALQMAGEMQRPDIIHAHGSVLSGSIAWKLAKKWKVPFVVTEHAGPVTVITESAWKYRWTKFVLERCDAMLSVSRHAEKEITNSGIRPKQSFVTWNPVDTDLFAPSAVKENKFLFAARLDSFKGGLLTLKAFANISDSFPDWKFQLAGEGEEMPGIKKFIEKHPVLKGRIALNGWLTKKDLAKEMSSARFFVFPSLHETFGLVAAEALSCGIPVITGNRTAMTEYVHDANGILVNAGSESEIEQALRNMIERHGAYDSLRLRAEIVQRFGFESFGLRMKEIYSSVISNFNS